MDRLASGPCAKAKLRPRSWTADKPTGAVLANTAHEPLSISMRG
jgi:hypothetical protein